MTIEIVLKTTEEGCIIPTSHKLNTDGYFRVRRDGKLIMYHRYTWYAAGNIIPEGHEIDHKCKNRACCNVEHLQCIPREQHLRETNEQRWAPRQQKAKEYWVEHQCSATDLAYVFKVSESATAKWIRNWCTPEELKAFKSAIRSEVNRTRTLTKTKEE